MLHKKMKMVGPTKVFSFFLSPYAFHLLALMSIVYAPSDIPYLEGYPHPIAMTENDMQNVEDAFVAALERCKRAGCMSNFGCILKATHI